MKLDFKILELIEDSDNPDLEKLAALFENAYNGASAIRTYTEKQKQVRFCDWEGLSLDGKKYGSELKPAFPWNGASDLRVFTIDDVLNKTVSAVLRAVWKARVIGVPKNNADFDKANKIASYVASYFKGLNDSRRELKLALNWAFAFGASAMGITWTESKIKKVSEITAISASEISENVTNVLGADDEPELTDDYNLAVADIKSAFKVSDSAAKDIIKKLKLFGRAEVLKDEIVDSRAKVKALKIGYDLILPEDCADIDSAPYVFQVEYLTASDVLARAGARLWKDSFVEKLLSNPEYCAEQNEFKTSVKKSESSRCAKFKLVTAYYSAVAKDNTLVRRFCVFNPDIAELAECAVLDLEPVRYPFELLTAEDVEREVLDSRGFCEIAEAWQREIKTQKDLRIDASSLAINPPKFYKAGSGITQFKPGGWYPMRQSDMKVLEEFRTSANPTSSVEIENDLRTQMINYFGGVLGETENSDATAQRVDYIESVFAFVSKILKQVQWLCAQYAPEKINFFDPEGEESEPVEFDRTDFETKFDITYSYDYNEENFERFIKKFEIVAKFVPLFDRNGDVKGLQFLRRLLSGLFPKDSRSFISSEKESSTREVLETQNDLAAIYSAQPVNAPEKCNAALRLQLCEQYMQTPSIAARLQADQDFALALSNYTKQLQFQIQQNQNATIGRLGTAPASGQASNLEA